MPKTPAGLFGVGRQAGGDTCDIYVMILSDMDCHGLAVEVRVNRH